MDRKLIDNLKICTLDICSSYYLGKNMTNQETNGKKYVCKLHPDLVKKADVELNEKAEWRDRDIQALREMVLKNAG